MKLDRKTKSKINAALMKAGMDGNGRFVTVRRAIGIAQELLLNENLWTQPDYRDGEIQRQFDLYYDDGATDEAQTIENSVLVVSAHYFNVTDRYEVVAYLS